MAAVLPTFIEDHGVSNIRSKLHTMELERKIGGLQNDIKALQLIVGGVASQEWVDHGILGRRVGSAWSNDDLFLERVDETASKIAPKNIFHQLAHWTTIEQAHEETARRPDTIKAQYCINTDSRNPVEQKAIIQSYTVEKLQEVFSLVSPKQLPYMSVEVKSICESYMNLRVARGMDDYILRTRTPKVSETIKKILRPHLGLSKQGENYNLYDVYFLLRQKIDGIPEPQKSQIVANWRSSSIAMRKSANFLKRESSYSWSQRIQFRKTPSRPRSRKGESRSETQNRTSPQPRKPIDPLKPEINYRTDHEPPSTNPPLMSRQPLQASSLESTTEGNVLGAVATSSPSMAKGCGRLLQQDPIRPAEWTRLRPLEETGLLNKMLVTMFSPLIAKGCDPTRPVKRIGPASLRKPWPLDRISALLWKRGLRSVLRRKI
ncbi:MAG: hypothetical protein LQ338_006446 [Usnochroma carphineum]|nr:MAG: hypothetical protein LQ338_006446 [Usnochroma carphineum]